MLHLFISYKSEDVQYVRGIQSIAKNSNNKIKFIDESLPGPIKNEYGHIITKSPHHEAASEVRNKIHQLLERSNRLLVIIGENTHSSEWVEWEIETFLNIHGNNKYLLLLRHRNCCTAGMPKYIMEEKIYDWDQSTLSQWLSS
ncbi:TIR domain-containing protein [Endozoicomonas sp. 8E]|uniref:TIR domain-containing protein n=1 Tax=Endozoicomonas sp. 8E TaxID=3035692 RepID=UPI002938F249|nr:TIR domain-containing protein [Endozoicomonas sp. 8E]WOG28756.1 TIR domain-containing protein [Endozoicomonas sp. 8E]